MNVEDFGVLSKMRVLKLLSVSIGGAIICFYLDFDLKYFLVSFSIVFFFCLVAWAFQKKSREK